MEREKTIKKEGQTDRDRKTGKEECIDERRVEERIGLNRNRL